jgi:hypothetical protein
MRPLFYGKTNEKPSYLLCEIGSGKGTEKIPVFDVPFVGWVTQLTLVARDTKLSNILAFWASPDQWDSSS